MRTLKSLRVRTREQKPKEIEKPTAQHELGKGEEGFNGGKCRK